MASGQGKWVTIVRGGKGLNIKSDPARLGGDEEKNVDFTSVSNIIIEDDRRISRCWGYTLRKAGVAKCAWSNHNISLCVLDNSLGLVNQDLSFSPLVTISVGENVAYGEWFNRVYWTTTKENGYIQQDKNFSWDKGTDFGPETEKEFTGPPYGSIIAFLNGRCYIADRSTLWYSQRWQPDLWRPATDYILLMDDITFLGPVDTGMWVGDRKGIYWIGGLDPEEQTMRLVANYPILSGTGVAMWCNETSYSDIAGAAWRVITPRGIMFLSNDGFMVLESDRRIETFKYPNALQLSSGCSGRVWQHSVWVLQ